MIGWCLWLSILVAPEAVEAELPSETFAYHEECEPTDARVWIVPASSMALVNAHVNKDTEPGWWFGAFFPTDPPNIFLAEELSTFPDLWRVLVTHEFQYLA